MSGTMNEPKTFIKCHRSFAKAYIKVQENSVATQLFSGDPVSRNIFASKFLPIKLKSVCSTELVPILN